MGGLAIIPIPTTVNNAAMKGKIPNFSLRVILATSPTNTEEQELITIASATGMCWIAKNWQIIAPNPNIARA